MAAALILASIIGKTLLFAAVGVIAVIVLFVVLIKKML
jgi:hypothetical protein